MQITDPIRMIILDVDGVLTDGRKYYDHTGKAVLKTFCDKDWTAIKKFRADGWFVVFLSGDRNINEAVARNRNIDFYCNRQLDGTNLGKESFVQVFQEKYKCLPENMVFVGDDIFDIGIMRKVGWAFCPNDAPKEVIETLSLSSHVTVLDSNGGDNCIVELADRLLPNDTESNIGRFYKILELDKNEKF